MFEEAVLDTAAKVNILLPLPQHRVNAFNPLFDILALGGSKIARVREATRLYLHRKLLNNLIKLLKAILRRRVIFHKLVYLGIYRGFWAFLLDFSVGKELTLNPLHPHLFLLLIDFKHNSGVVIQREFVLFWLFLR